MVPPASGRFCPYCGRTNPDEYRFCEGCHRALPEGAGRGAKPHPGRRRVWYIAAVAIATAVALLAVGELVPVSNNFGLSVESRGLSTSTAYHAFPANAPVRFHWSTDDGRSVTFTLVDAEGHALARASGANGSFSFTSQGGLYGFESYSWLIEVVSVQGSYDAPWLAGTT